MVTNGTASLEIANALNGIVDAYNIDLKGITQEYYAKLQGNLAMVQDFITAVVPHSHVELTVLIVPSENDSVAAMEELSSWIAKLSSDIPLHVSRFFPCFEWEDHPATPVKTIYDLADVARKKLKYVYTGNC